jgi:hypothetical protein
MSHNYDNFMKPRTIEHLQYFVGKVCSIVTTSMNRSFDEKISREHFVVLIGEIDSECIWGVHPYNTTLASFFNIEHVISIHEEEVIDPSNPEHAKMIKEFEEKTGKKLQGDLKNSPPISVNKPEQKSVPVEKKNLLNVINEESPVQSDPSTGDATFIDIAGLERMAEFARRAFEQKELLDKQDLFDS